MGAAFGSDRTHIINPGYVVSFSHWALHCCRPIRKGNELCVMTLESWGMVSGYFHTSGGARGMGTFAFRSVESADATPLQSLG